MATAPKIEIPGQIDAEQTANGWMWIWNTPRAGWYQSPARYPSKRSALAEGRKAIAAMTRSGAM